MIPTPTPPPGLSVLSAQQQRANELTKIAKTQIVFKIGGLTEENFAYAQQEIQAVVRQNPGDTDLFYIQRLIHASISALGFQSSHNLSSGLILNSPSQSQLALRLLTSELKLLARDPFSSHKFATALAAALHAGDPFELPSFVRATTLSPLERLLLLPPLLGLLSLTPPPPPPTAPLPPGLPPPPVSSQYQHPALLAKKRQIARDAAQILRETIGAALHSLSIPVTPPTQNPPPSTPNSNTNPTDEQLTDLTAIQLSKLLAIIISDTTVPAAVASEEQEQEPEWLWTPTVQRAAVQALVSRVGQELASQIANHCLSEARFSSNPTPISLLYRICSDPTICTADLCKSVLIKTGRAHPTGSAEGEVSDQLRELILLATKYGAEFHIDHVSWIRGVGELYSNRIRWSDVIQLTFDRPNGVTLPEAWGLRFLAKVLSLAPSLTPSPSDSTAQAQEVSTPTSTSSHSAEGSTQSDAAPTELAPSSTEPTRTSTGRSTAAISSLFERWRSPLAKVQLIDRLLSLPLDASPFLHALKPTPLAPMVGPACHRLVAAEEVALMGASATIRLLAKSVEMSGWNVKELLCEITSLLGQAPVQEPDRTRLEDGEAEKVIEKASEIMERACKANPELVMIALIQVERPWGVLHTDLASQLLQSFLTGHPSHQLVFLRIWQLDPSFLMAALREFYESNEMNVTRVLDIAQDLKILEQVLNCQPSVQMVLDLASLASRREYLNLDKWLGDRLSSYGRGFANGCLEFLAKKVSHDLGRQTDGPASNTLTAAEPSTLSLSAPTVSIFIRIIRHHHELLSVEELERFKEVRTQAVQLHPKLMNFLPGNEDEPGIQLSSFDSRTEAEVDAFYKKMYDLELSVDQIVGILRAMRDSSEVHSHQFLACLLSGLFDEYKFFATYPAKELGLTAALFGSLIREQLIGYVPLGIAVRYVLDAIRHPIESKWYAFGSQALARFQTRLEEWPQLAAAVSEVESLKLTHPEVYLRAKSVITGDRFDENQYLSTLVGKGGDEDLVSRSLIGGEQQLTRTDSEDSDEGLVPLLFPAIQSDDDLIKRELKRRKMLGTYQQDQSIQERYPRLMTSKESFVEPPESVSDKILFIVNNLAPNNLESKLTELSDALSPEFHGRAGLKLNLKFEIEVLCKALEVELNEIKGSEEVRRELEEVEEMKKVKEGREVGEGVTSSQLPLHSLHQHLAASGVGVAAGVGGRTSEMEIENVIGRATGMTSQPPQSLHHQPQVSQDGMDGIGKIMGGGLQPLSTGQGGLGGQVGYANSLQDLLKQALVELPLLMRFGNSGVSSDENRMKWWRGIVFNSIERAIRDIIGPVVERSVTIASLSTRELMLKDFAMEGDENKMRLGSMMMVRGLAGSLALVTTKEPLRNMIISNLRSSVSSFDQWTVEEDEILGVTNDNLEVGCQVIEKVAAQKAMMEIEISLGPAFEARRRHREHTTNAFWDTSAMAASHYSGMLPMPLRLKLGGLDEDQLRIYQEFSIHPSVPNQSVNLNAWGQTGVLVGSKDEEAGRDGEVRQKDLVNEAMNAINSLAAELDSTTNVDESSIKEGLETLLGYLNEGGATLMVAQKSVAMLYRSQSDRLGREVFVRVLERICFLSPKVGQEVCQWLLYAEDERKYSVPVTLALVSRRIVPVVEFDGVMARLILKDFKPTLMSFIAQFLEAIVESEGCVIPIGMMKHSIMALNRAVQIGRASAEVTSILERMQNKLSIVMSKESDSKLINNTSTREENEIREQLSFCFAEWIRLYSNSYSIEKPFIDFIGSLQAHGILKGEELSSAFFRICMELSLDSYIKSKANGGQPNRGIFQPVDGFAKLISLMIKYHTDPTGEDIGKAKTHYMMKLLSIVLLVMSKFQKELGRHFQQKPFFRFFSSLLVHLNSLESHLGNSYQSLMMTISNLIDSMQPANFPGFATSWMALISHRLLMPKLLMFKDREGWATVHRLLLTHLRFLKPFLKENQKMDEVSQTLYTGTVRIFLVLLHDFPTFLAFYYHSFLNELPIYAIQLSNVILAAYPIGIRLVDPFGNGFCLENCKEVGSLPLIGSDFISVLETKGIKEKFEKVFSEVEKGEVGERLEIGRKELIECVKDRIEIDRTSSTGFINGLVLSLGIKAIGGNTGNVNRFDEGCESVVILKELVESSDPEVRYMILVSCIYQLRWPNAHTNWYVNLLLYLYSNQSSTGTTNGVDPKEIIKEQILRVFLERILVQRPHPFGIIYGFIKVLGLMKEEKEKELESKSGVGEVMGGGGGGGLRVIEECKELKALFGICRRFV
ncbi:CCR4-Not complex component, Not1-domain-containing protein [Melampsora americana]|nr:CCR4-Not complex component, Not1-domain-containing protein [Melampsora americana]